jgi:hypothetical protein
MRYQHAPSLRLTGERTMPGLPHENYWISDSPTLS